MTEKSLDKWFDFPAGSFCGLVVREPSAKKLMKILYRQTQEIKEFLNQHKEDAAPSNWTLAYPGGKQTVIRYTCKQDEWDNVDSRIKLYDATARMRYIENGLFISSEKSLEAAKEAVAEYYRVTDTEPPEQTE